MPDPILVEERFQILVEELESVESIRQRISLIRDFIHFLEGDYGKYESYVIELIQFWPLYSGPVTYSGISPAEILDDLRLLDEITSKIKTLVHQEKVSDITERLREVAAILFVCLGEVQSALRMVGQPGERKRREIPNIENETETENRHHHSFKDIKKMLLLEFSSKPKEEVPVNIDRFVGDLEYILKKHNGNEALVPVVEYFETLDRKPRSYGRLRRLHVRVVGLNNQQKDRIVRRYNVVGVEKPSWEEDSKVSKAARALLGRFSEGIDMNFYDGEIFYEYSGAMHQGNSSNAATAALWFTGIQKKEELRERYQINKNIIITGDIDCDGNILPVSETGIRAKVQAAFYSWATTLIVPASQTELFRNELSKLKSKHPWKVLTLLPLQRLDELFYDRRITSHLNPSRVRYLADRMWDQKFEVAGVISILMLSLIIFRLVYGPLDKNPTVYEYSGEMLQVMNKAGLIVEELVVGETTVTNMENRRSYKLVDFADVLQDGTNEIIWGENFPNSSGSIYMKKVGFSELIWQRTMNYSLDFPNKPYVLQNNYRLHKMRVGDFNIKPGPDLLVSIAHRPYFPGILSYRDATDGREISKYVHPGRINDFIIEDINGDGRLEVILSGINNAYNNAFLAVLEMENISGFGPATEEYYLQGYETAEMISYILFPKTIIADAITSPGTYNNAYRISYLEEHGLLEVNLNDFTGFDFRNDGQIIEDGRMYVYLNSELDVHGIGTSDGFDTTAEFLYENGTIARYPDQAYFKEYKDSIMYWNGEEFVSRDPK